MYVVGISMWVAFAVPLDTSKVVPPKIWLNANPGVPCAIKFPMKSKNRMRVR